MIVVINLNYKSFTNVTKKKKMKTFLKKYSFNIHLADTNPKNRQFYTVKLDEWFEQNDYHTKVGNVA